MQLNPGPQASRLNATNQALSWVYRRDWLLFLGRSVYRLSGIKTADPPATLSRVPDNPKIIVE